MKMQFHCLLAVGVATLGTVTAINAAVAAADPQVCEPAAGVHECTSPGHAGPRTGAPRLPQLPRRPAWRSPHIAVDRLEHGRIVGYRATDQSQVTD